MFSGANRVDPVIRDAGRLPFRLEDRVFKKLDEMVAECIITPVQEPTEWVSQMMVVGQPGGDVRICLDPSEMKKSSPATTLLSAHRRTTLCKTQKVRYFCSLDAASGFYQIPLSHAALYFCTMATPRSDTGTSACRLD